MLVVSTKILVAQDARIESGLMYYFALNTEWPASKKTGDFVIVVVGSAKIEPFLKSLARTKKVGNQTIVIKKVSAVSEVGNCHIMFFAKAMKAILPEAIKVAKSKNILVVTEGFGKAKKGAGISFTITSGTADFKLKTSYDVNPTSIVSSGLKANKKLLDLGTVVKPN